MDLPTKKVAVPPCPTCGSTDKKTVKIRAGRWYCYRCEAPLPRGTEITPTVRDPISNEYVEKSHARLMASSSSLEWLETERRIDHKTARREMLGLDSGRIQIPIPGADGDFVNVRQARPGEKLRPLEKGRSVQLYPGEIDECELLLVCEGEWDRLAAVSLGYNACCGTGGAGVFHHQWAKEISEKAENVALVFDVDHAGRSGARRAVNFLLEAGLMASQIRVVNLPLSGKKDENDLTDWIKAGGTRELLDKLIEDTPKWEQFERSEGSIPEDSPERTLMQAGHKSHARQWSWINASVVALLNDSYQLPTKVSLRCPQDQGKLCSTCQMVNFVEEAAPGEDPVVPLDTTDDRFVEHIGAPKAKLREQVLASIGVQPRCPAVEMEDIESVPVQEGRVGELLTINADVKSQDRAAIFVDLEDVIEANKEYRVLGRFMPHPRDQVWTAIVHRAEGVDQVVDNFEEKPGVLRPLTRRRDLQKTVKAILADAEEITGIRERPDMHLMILLSMYSTLTLSTSRGPKRGWLDVAVVGDTSQGKSPAMKNLSNWTGLGSVVAFKRTTTRAGFFGGVTMERKKPVIAWGVYPRHDRRWMGLDEVHTAEAAIISAMTSARSEGVAETYMANVHEQTYCRVRLCWGMNPRSELPVAAHAFGFDVITQGFKRPEDIRRLDAALVVADGEISDAAADPARKQLPPKLFTQDLAKHLQIRAWAQRDLEVDHLMGEANRHRNYLSSRYVSTPPLVEPNDLSWKLVRLAVALANLTGQEVSEEHIEFVAEWLDGIYSSETFGLLHYSELERSRSTLANEGKVRGILKGTGDAKAAAEILLLQPEWRTYDFQALVRNGEQALGLQLLSILVRNRAMVREGGSYRKTPAFVKLLQEIVKEGD